MCRVSSMPWLYIQTLMVRFKMCQQGCLNSFTRPGDLTGGSNTQASTSHDAKTADGLPDCPSRMTNSCKPQVAAHCIVDAQAAVHQSSGWQLCIEARCVMEDLLKLDLCTRSFCQHENVAGSRQTTHPYFWTALCHPFYLEKYDTAQP